MSNEKIKAALVKDGFTLEFAQRAVQWLMANFSSRFLRGLKSPVRFIKDNEYVIRLPW